MSWTTASSELNDSQTQIRDLISIDFQSGEVTPNELDND